MDFRSPVVWRVSFLPQMSSLSSLFSRFLGIGPSVLTRIDICDFHLVQLSEKVPHFSSFSPCLTFIFLVNENYVWPFSLGLGNPFVSQNPRGFYAFSRTVSGLFIYNLYILYICISNLYIYICISIMYLYKQFLYTYLYINYIFA